MASNTKLLRHENGNFVIRFYFTPIVVIMPDGYWISSGGRQTAALLHRLTKFSPVVIRVVGGKWFVKGEKGFNHAFHDGMVLNWKGHPVDEQHHEPAVPEPATTIPISQ